MGFSHMNISPAATTLGAVAAGCFALAMGACTTTQYGSACPIPENGASSEKLAAFHACLGQIGEDVVDTRLKKDVDILFAIDNSPSMSPKQKALAKSIPAFIKTIDQTGANYHVGIVTSDIGSTVAPGSPWGPGVGTCDTFEGDNGVLQNLACTARSGVTPEARAACASLCPDDRFVPNDGKRFISKIDGMTNVPKDLKPDPANPTKNIDFGPINAFQCMALVGDAGCGIEGQLEAVRRALDTRNTDNSGFLRANSVLAIIFITDEDDCSVQMTRRAENNPFTRDCGDPDQNASYDCFSVDFRCVATDFQCDQPMNTPGAKTNCHERSTTRLEPLEKYYKFLSMLRLPDKLIISGIWTLPSATGGAKVNIAYNGGTTSPYLNRSLGADASCHYTGADASFNGVFGQAQLRLSRFAGLFGKDKEGQPNVQEVSICDIDNYEQALSKLAKAIEQKITGYCLPLIPKLKDGQPLCYVGDVDASSPSNSPDSYFPVCSSSCCKAWADSKEPTVEDPNIQMACKAEAADCFCALKSNVGMCADTVVAGIWRKDNAMPPPNKVVSFRCAAGG